ncbi:mitogen-activated protein kinase kinase kinase 5-like, partial [Impatiens glandulifera]|uniref:mitogen-activated protein kinase kinase kinase 5-like n=1 Tax=Impatiens glandulifera TaxID=253017 RepID=UPI001FB0B67F
HFSKPFTSFDTVKSAEHTETHKSKNGFQDLNGVEKFLDGSSTAISAPTSPYSSPALSPTRYVPNLFTSSYNHHTKVHIWSAPEMPAWEMNLGFSSQSLPEKAPCGYCDSPQQSPNLTSPRNALNLSMASLSVQDKVPTENPTIRRENNVHPLPLPPGPLLPPGATVPTMPVHVSQVTRKPEPIPICSHWSKGKLIGRGTFGSVYCASNRETGALCAMKEVDLFPDDPKSAESIKQLEQEIEVLSRLKHQNIVQYYGSEVVGERFHIYLEYVHPGSINKYVRDHCGGAMTESVVRNFTRHILSGLAYLHGMKTIHRDIKGANLLVDANGVVKLADFGMAKHLVGPIAELSLKGSPYWMAPELIQSVSQKDASPDLAFAVDIWSLGCTVIEMMNGRPPWSDYEGAAAMFRALKENPPMPESLSSEGKDFLQCCFHRNPAERPRATALLDHPFVKNSQQQQQQQQQKQQQPVDSIQKFPQALINEIHSLPTDKAPPRSRQLLNQRPGPLILPPDQFSKGGGRPAAAAATANKQHEIGTPPEITRVSPRSTLDFLSPQQSGHGSSSSRNSSSYLMAPPPVMHIHGYGYVPPKRSVEQTD